MSIYVVGDVQGCLDPLMRLLDQIHFDPSADTLWFTGDLVNRGPDSLGVLQFIHGLGSKHKVVLGNHDLHLLAMAAGHHVGFEGDTLLSVIHAEDGAMLLDWLCAQPLLYHDREMNYVMTHAGIPPQWRLSDAKARAAEVEAVLRNPDQRTEYFKHMYGNQPDYWQADLSGWERLRCITNYFTRMRFCYPDGRLSYSDTMDAGTSPWFRLRGTKDQGLKIVFGHWAALGGKTDTENIFALDTGCVWGYSLTALRLQDLQRFSVPCPVS